MFEIALDILTDILAMFTIVILAKEAILEKCRLRMFMILFALYCSILLLIAQTSWLHSYVILGDLLGTAVANLIWTIFNVSVLCFFLFFARAKHDKS